ARNAALDRLEVVQDVLGGDARSEAVPRAPACRRPRGPTQRMICREPCGDVGQQLLAVPALATRELFELPCFARRKRQPFGVDDDLERPGTHAKRAAEAAARGEREDAGG